MPQAEQEDVKPAVDSSPKADVMESSSDSESSTPTSDQTLDEFVASQVEEFKTATDVEEEEKAKELDSKDESDKKEKQPAQDKKEAEEEGEKKEELTEEKKTEEEQHVPYERFKEINDAKVRLEDEVRMVEPKVKAYESITNYCQERNITPEQFNEALTVQGLINSDPAKALEKLLPIVEQLQGFTGNRLPNDLQQRVDSGKMEYETAKEIASLRAQVQFGQRKVEFDNKANLLKQQQKLQAELNNAAASWERTKRTSDPDYKPKSSETAPDGVFEITRDKFLAAIGQTMTDPVSGQLKYVNQLSSPQDMNALQEKCYNAAKQLFRPRNQKPTPKRLPSNGSSGVTSAGTIASAPTMLDAVKRGLANRELIYSQPE